MTARLRIPHYFSFTYQAASRSNNPQSLPPFDQSLRQSRLGTLKPLRRRTLHRRIRHSWNASRCSSLFSVVGFAGRAPFLVALHRIVPRWPIRTQTRPPAYHRFNGVGLRTCNSCLDFLFLSGVPGQHFLRIAFALELRRPRLPLIFPFISFRLSVAGRVRRIVAIFVLHRSRLLVLPHCCRVGDIWRRLTVTFSNPSRRWRLFGEGTV